MGDTAQQQRRFIRLLLLEFDVTAIFFMYQFSCLLFSLWGHKWNSF